MVENNPHSCLNFRFQIVSAHSAYCVPMVLMVLEIWPRTFPACKGIALITMRAGVTPYLNQHEGNMMVHEGNKKNTSDFHSNNNSSERKMAGRKPYVRAQQTTITTKRAELQVHSFRTSLWLTFTHIRKCSDWIQAASYFHTKTSTHTYFAQYTMRVARCWFSQPNQNLGQPEMIEAMCLF